MSSAGEVVTLLLTIARLKVRPWHYRAPLPLAVSAKADGSTSLEGDNCRELSAA